MAYRIYARGKAKNRIQALEIENKNPYTIEIKEIISAIKNFGFIRFLTYLLKSLSVGEKESLGKWAKEKDVVKPEIIEVQVPATTSVQPLVYPNGTSTNPQYNGTFIIGSSHETFDFSSSDWKSVNGSGDFRSNDNNTYTSSSGNQVNLDWNYFNEGNNNDAR